MLPVWIIGNQGVQAKAWLEGRDTVAPADLIILRHYLWTAPEERAIIQSALVTMS